MKHPVVTRPNSHPGLQPLSNRIARLASHELVVPLAKLIVAFLLFSLVPTIVMSVVMWGRTEQLKDRASRIIYRNTVARARAPGDFVVGWTRKQPLLDRHEHPTRPGTLRPDHLRGPASELSPRLDRPRPDRDRRACPARRTSLPARGEKIEPVYAEG